MIFIVLLSPETVHDTVQYRYCIFSLLNRLLKIRLKVGIPYFHTYEREREKVHCECTMYCTVHFIITLFNVVNVLLCVIYQLNFTVFMYVTRISRYDVIYSVRYYPRLSVTAVGLGTYYPWIRRSSCIFNHVTSGIDYLKTKMAEPVANSPTDI